MWYIETDNVVRVKNLQSVETEAYVNDAAVTAILHQLPAFNADVAVAVDKGSGLVGIPITGHDFDVLGGIRIEGSLNYDADYIVEVGTTTDEVVITATYIAETFTGSELMYKSIVGTVNSPITFTYEEDSNGDYVGRIPKTAPLVQNVQYMLTIWEISGSDQVLAKVTEVAGYQGLM